MKRTVLITPDFPPTTGGIQTYLYNLFSKNKDCDVIAPNVRDTRNNLIDDSYPAKIYRFNYLNSPYQTKLSYFFKVVIRNLYLIKKQNYQFIHCGHVFPSGLTGYYANKFLHIPYSIFTHAMEIKQIENLPKDLRDLYIAVLKNAKRISSVSQYTRNVLIDLGIDKNNIILIPPGVDYNAFSPGEKDEFLVKKHGLEDSFTLLTVSRLVERKGHDKVIDALSTLRNDIPNIKYLIVGKGPYEDVLKEQVKLKGLDDIVKFVGFVPDADLEQYYRTCDLFLMPSREIYEKGDVEGFGIVYSEASACEKPVIGGRSGGVSDAVLEGKTGLLVNPTNTKEIADSIKLLCFNSDLRLKMGKEGRKRVIEELSWDNLSGRVHMLEGN